MFFYDPSDRAAKELIAGVLSKTFWGEKMLISLVDVAAGATIPAHQHPHEQVGVVTQGEFLLTVGEESRQVKVGDIYIIPGGVDHGVIVGNQPAQAFEVFSPVRDEYKFP